MKTLSIQIRIKGGRGWWGHRWETSPASELFLRTAFIWGGGKAREVHSMKFCHCHYSQKWSPRRYQGKRRNAKFFSQHSVLAYPPQSFPRWKLRNGSKKGMIYITQTSEMVCKLWGHTPSAKMLIHTDYSYPITANSAWESYWPSGPERLIALVKLMQIIVWLILSNCWIWCLVILLVV